MTMYIRKTVRRYKDKTYENYLLVESVLTDKGPRQKVICSLGDLSPGPPEQWLALARKLQDALTGQLSLPGMADEDPELQRLAHALPGPVAPPGDAASATPTATPRPDDLVSVHIDRVTCEQPRPAGHIHVGLQFWKRLGLDDILGALGFAPRLVALTCAMTLNRLIHPAAEYAMPDWFRSTAMADLLGVDFARLPDDPLDRNLDRLHPHRAAIESALAQRERSLFDLDETILLYDLTSTYFEGKAERNPKAKRGYSRDHRPDCKQVVVGLVIGREGFPRAHEIFEGNAQDRQTLGAMLGSLERRVGLAAGATVVVDRGMAFAENIAELRRRELHYVVAAGPKERDRLLGEFETAEGFEEVVRRPSPRNSGQKKSSVRVKAHRTEKELLILCISQERVEKDRAIRAKQEGRSLKDLAKVRARIEAGRLKKEVKIGEAIGRLKERYPRVARYYALSFDAKARRLTGEPDEPRRQVAASLDGSYLLRTDRQDLTAEEAWRIYAALTRAEGAFRSMKSPLCERPIFHHLEHRVESHIFLCVLAYHLLVAIETTLLRQEIHTSWATVRDLLATHQVVTIALPTDRDGELRIRRGATPEADHKVLYEALGVPMEIMRPVKTWEGRPPNSD
ncbi:MAG: IS1634 family transposase [Acidimicrobiales bacterium]|nr:IS1634 family transposase [Acidimicrobiales bacterium]